jgi:hypothetical protein
MKSEAEAEVEVRATTDTGPAPSGPRPFQPLAHLAPGGAAAPRVEGVASVLVPAAQVRPLLSGVLAAVIGVLGTVATFAAGTGLIPWPYSLAVAVVGMAAALLTGTFSKVPNLAVGRPLIPLTLIPSAVAISGYLVDLAVSIPEGFSRGAALAGAALASWLAGKVFTPPMVGK